MTIYEDEFDEYDREFIRMREKSMKSKQAKLTEELDRAKHAVDECKRFLVDKRKQVIDTKRIGHLIWKDTFWF